MHRLLSLNKLAGPTLPGDFKIRIGALASWPVRAQSLLKRPLTGALLLAGAIAGSLATPEPAKALTYVPGQGYASSLILVIQCGAFGPLAVPPCPKIFSKRRARKIYVIQDPPGSGLTSFSTNFSYDPTVMTFDRQQTSLLCELRSASATPFCPDTAGGVGTQPLGTIDDFAVDQTGLTIQEDSDTSSVAISYTSATPITFTGERNFLALAFDLLVPLEPGATVTYSPTSLSDATLSITQFSCDVECSSSHPAVALKLNAVPAPLAVGGLPVMVHASRRMRHRIRQAAR
jgi:hypothetical protein